MFRFTIRDVLWLTAVMGHYDWQAALRDGYRRDGCWHADF